MAQIIWSARALEDAELIAEYIARDSSEQAALFVSRLIEAVDYLKDFPNSGRIIPEISHPSCREVLYKSFRIMYFLKENETWITQVVHGARNWKPWP